MTNAEAGPPAPGSTTSSARGSKSRRACLNCAKIKEKCIILENTSDKKCQRCHRLRKDCVVPTAPSRKRARTPANTGASAYSTPATTEASSIICSSIQRFVSPHSFSAAPILSESHSGPVSETLSELPTAQKETLYADFQNDMNIYHPFLVLDDNCKTAAACEQHAPVTFAACIAAALHRYPTLQRRVSLDVLSHVAQSMFPFGRKSMDLLTALNILIAWYMYYVQRNPQLVNLVFLVKALLVDLGLTVPSMSRSPFVMMSDFPKLMHGPGIDSNNHGLGGIRALLMSWYTNAQLSICYHRLEYPHWSPHLEDCLQKLKLANYSALDLQSTHVASLYATMERYLGVDAVRPSANLPIRAYVRYFRDDLQRIRSSLPQAVANNQHFPLHLQSIEIALYDSVTSAHCDHPAQMLEALHALLAAINTFFDLFLSQPSEIFPYLTFLSMTQASHAFDILAKLSFFKYDGWDLNYVRTSHSFSTFIERIIDKFDDVYMLERSRFPELDNFRFAIYPTKLRQCKKWYEESVASEAKEALEQAQGNPVVMGNVSNMPDIDFNQFPDLFGDQAWWTYDGRFDVQ